MKVAVIGSRSIIIKDIGRFLPPDTTEIISGGANGVDKCAAEYAVTNGIPLVEILPDYDRYGRRAPLFRNEEIVRHADTVIAFWDGKSRGTIHTAKLCKKMGVPIRIFKLRLS
ncbi:MAG: DUF2493 domain-containing protein [Clostridia bacterium]|nr:DUF2493 domain-containing protein [Clostridia bacterium]